ncbi:SRPBCC family protein [Lacimicrobium alkaliphilum]|uniref:Activator of HSP90 ATPase n=1 Tax=Lacimicrobium alkaliphilum TaxID=1526571 RepID=A0ABQ1QZJ5_9ALTE|nr:SRPBCC domain-containing protein [Lacimicrobium alkaliphilum]GGD50673.1 activator of HSP90 ATPase [Lacimicrobium alkaliphilum]
MHEVKLEVKFDAPVEALFEAWFKPELLLQWFAPGEMILTQAMSSFSVGGKYRMVMQDPEYQQYYVTGEYTEIEENQRLAFTWQIGDQEPVSQVALTFERLNDSTSSMTLVHSELADVEMQEHYQAHWIASLEKLSLLTL